MAGARLGGLAGDRRHAAPVDADRRQGAAGLTPGNHWWGVTFYVNRARPHHVGDSLRPAHVRRQFDFIDHVLRIGTSDGGDEQFAAGADVALRRSTPQCFALARRSASTPHIWTMPVEIAAMPIPFTEDDGPRRLRRRDGAALLAGAGAEPTACSRRFRARFLGKVSPVHFFWGSFDLAVTRFSGRRAPPHPGASPHLADRGDAGGLFARGVAAPASGRARRLRPRRVLLPTPIPSRRAWPRQRSSRRAGVRRHALKRVPPALRGRPHRRRSRRDADELPAGDL